MNYNSLSIKKHRQWRGKLAIKLRMPLANRHDLSLAYTPGVAGPSLAIAQNPKLARSLTSSQKTIAVISDGSAVLGLGNIGARAALPVMEGKCALFKKFAGLDAWPIVLASQDVDTIVKTIINIAPTFGGINLEDISAPRCFEIERRLSQALDLPVFHDDQHGTAIVVLAGLINALKVARLDKKKAKVVISGAGAAGIAITKLLSVYGFRQIVMVDSRGIIYRGRTSLNPEKKNILSLVNKNSIKGALADALRGADIFIGVSRASILKPEYIKSMASRPIILAMANPVPEVMPDLALKAGAYIVATGRSDFANQLNNVLVFPGIFKGAIEAGVHKFTTKMKIAAAESLARVVKKPRPDKIIASIFDRRVVKAVAQAVKNNI